MRASSERLATAPPQGDGADWERRSGWGRRLVSLVLCLCLAVGLVIRQPQEAQAIAVVDDALIILVATLMVASGVAIATDPGLLTAAKTAWIQGSQELQDGLKEALVSAKGAQVTIGKTLWAGWSAHLSQFFTAEPGQTMTVDFSLYSDVPVVTSPLSFPLTPSFGPYSAGTYSNPLATPFDVTLHYPSFDVRYFTADKFTSSSSAKYVEVWCDIITNTGLSFRYMLVNHNVSYSMYFTGAELYKYGQKYDLMPTALQYSSSSSPQMVYGTRPTSVCADGVWEDWNSWLLREHGIDAGTVSNSGYYVGLEALGTDVLNVPYSKVGAADGAISADTDKDVVVSVPSDIGQLVDARPADVVVSDTTDPGGGGEGEDEGPDFPDVRLPAILTDKFPFCIPYDLYRAVKSLSTTGRKAPSFEVNFLGTVETIDLSQFEGVAAVLRWGFLVAFNVGLIMVTRKLIKG